MRRDDYVVEAVQILTSVGIHPRNERPEHGRPTMAGWFAVHDERVALFATPSDCLYFNVDAGAGIGIQKNQNRGALDELFHERLPMRVVDAKTRYGVYFGGGRVRDGDDRNVCRQAQECLRSLSAAAGRTD